MKQMIRQEPQRPPDSPEAAVMRCAFTGCRPQKMPFGFNEEDLRCMDFKRRIGRGIAALIAGGCSHFLTGGALGFDTFAAEAVMDLRREHPWITLEIAVPFPGQPAYWDSRSQDRYRWILNQADIVTCISDSYTQSCMDQRNRYLVDHCDLLVAAWSGLPGGTEQTLAYARSVGREIRIIPITPDGMNLECGILIPHHGKPGAA